jgi:hypothetical protein
MGWIGFGYVWAAFFAICFGEIYYFWRLMAGGYTYAWVLVWGAAWRGRVDEAGSCVNFFFCVFGFREFAFWLGGFLRQPGFIGTAFFGILWTVYFLLSLYVVYTALYSHYLFRCLL